MKGTMKQRLIAWTVVSSMAASGTAMAGIPVFDAMNFASNVVQNVQLMKMRKALTSESKGTVNYNIGEVNKSTLNISKETTNILDITKNNTIVDVDFTWIIKKGGGGEIIPVPRKSEEGKDDLLGDKLDVLFDGGAKKHVAKFKSADEYGDTMPVPSTADAISKIRKNANDVLAYSLDSHREGLNEEAEQLSALIEQSVGKESVGHGKQLQLANALSGSQANQLVQIRSLMLAAESARVVEFEASVDREARERATSRALRKGLDETRKSLRTANAEH